MRALDREDVTVIRSAAIGADSLDRNRSGENRERSEN
jgi:hypothetical protein